MGKTYIDTVKYLVKSTFDIDGMVEKPDIVGAVFGQTEGLLGDELDLRELQKNGRIGRIEVSLQVKGGKCNGTILIPSSLDIVETSILAASLEIVDRVGPCEARFQVEKIEDTRNLKRKIVLDRAKLLLRNVMADEMPDSKALSEMVRGEVKIAEVQSYGEDKLPCGPEVATSDQILVVEGRADVINLLKNGIKNAVAIGGANVGKTIIELCKAREATVFLDGDRGGDIILRELTAQTDIDYVCRAPPGKEVEELSRKELIMAMRRKTPIAEATNELNAASSEREARFDYRKKFDRRPEGRAPMDSRQPVGDRAVRRPMQEQSGDQAPSARYEQMATQRPQMERAPLAAPRDEMSPEDKAKADQLKSGLKELEGSLKARMLGPQLNLIGEVPIREIMGALADTGGVYAVVLDGIVTQRLVDLAEQKGVKFAVGIRAGNITRQPAGLKVVVSETAV